MLRRCMSAAVVMFVLGGFVVAGTHYGQVIKVEDGKITVKVRTKEDKKGTEKTFKVSKDAKFIVKGKTKDDEDKEIKVEDVKSMIEKAKESKGKRRGGAKIETTGEGDDETVTKITFGGFGKGKGKKNKDE